MNIEQNSIQTQQTQATVEQQTQATVEIKYNRIWGGAGSYYLS